MKNVKGKLEEEKKIQAQHINNFFLKVAQTKQFSKIQGRANDLSVWKYCEYSRF